MGNSRFRYALQPMLLTRQWELDRLRSELGELHAAWSKQNAALQVLLQRQQASMGEWNALGSSAQSLSVDSFVMLSRYIGDCARQAGAERQALDALEAQMEELTARLRLAQRALEAVEEHREKMQAQFVQAKVSLDFKAADDQWGMSRTRGEEI